MAQIKAITARGLLDEIAQGAAQTSVDLIDAIRAAKKQVYTSSFKQGRVYVATSGSGQSASFLIPSELTSDFSPVKVADQLQEFVEIYSDCVTGFGGQVTPSITDATDVATDLAAMLADDRLQTVTHQRLDITSIRWPATTTSV